ncbi:MAG: RHS repeat-associated core domain-containing protein [Thermoanaerobaculia bacterium]|nr:RHS repeat-associated core domain-containing protein [Thermoanaerobaculia bacterium]
MSRFAYDALSRLTEGRVRVGGSDFVQEVEFDAFGNITEVTTSTFPPRALETSTSTNHLTYGTYNPAGSLTSWNLWSYAWDPVEMMKRRSTDGQDWRHVYTAGDERFWNVNISDWKTSDFTLRDLDGRVLRVYEAGEGKWSRFTDYVWRGDALLARDFSYTRPEAFHLDHLGTPRLLTNHRAERLAQPNYYPFGEEITVNTQVAERLKFTGHERDTLGSEEVADDLDYMHARFANPITGRFLSTDPVVQVSRSIRRPQLWNRYAYSLGNPIKYVDPTGAVAVLTGSVEAQSNTLEALRNSVPRELRVFLRARLAKDGQLVIDAHALRKAPGGMRSANFRALLAVAASRKVFELGTVVGTVATSKGPETLGGATYGLFLDQGGSAPEAIGRSCSWRATSVSWKL